MAVQYQRFLKKFHNSIGLNVYFKERVFLGFDECLLSMGDFCHIGEYTYHVFRKLNLAWKSIQCGENRFLNFSLVWG